MTEAVAGTRSVVLERTYPHPPARIWRALTQPHLLREWLMESDFAAEPGRAFTFRGDWGSVAGEVTEVEHERVLAYSWSAMGLESIVTWTLTPQDGGTLLRIEQAGFRADQNQAFHGARYGWTNFLGRLDNVLARDGEI